ncbi:aminoglycoside phosphotransferase family protein [Streptosporangium sp. KLBMP 9127]|nr:aminoglycoside phosphotransferase family protein [Streptosporangium sp. KLBMP 9127]
MSPSDFHTRRLVAAGIISRDAILTELAGGIDNRIYAVDSGNLIVRIRRGDRPARFASAAWAAGEMAAIGMPVPTVIWYDEDLCIETRCPGSPLWCAGVSPDGLAAAVEAGKLLRRVHTITVRGFGRLDRTGTGPHPSARAWLVALPPDPVADLSRLLARARQALAAGAVLLPDGPSRLLHGDLTARHVIVDGGEVTGLVDLESVRGGDPLAEIAGWSLQEPPPLTDALLSGYFTTSPDQAAVTTLALYRIRIAGSLLCHHITRGDNASALLRTAQIEADLADLGRGDPQLVPRIQPSLPNLRRTS